MSHTHIDMRPSQVRLRWPHPLVGALGKAEAEMAAGLLVLVCQKEDKWRSCSPLEIGTTLRDDERLKDVRRNPFFFPDFHELVKRDFATSCGRRSDVLDDGDNVAFTMDGLRQIFLNWYWPDPFPCPKCNALARCVEWWSRTSGFRPTPPLFLYSPLDAQNGIALGDATVTEMYKCIIHGEFGIVDGVAEYLEPDTWVRGPRGERMFQI